MYAHTQISLSESVSKERRGNKEALVHLPDEHSTINEGISTQHKDRVVFTARLIIYSALKAYLYTGLFQCLS